MSDENEINKINEEENISEENNLNEKDILNKDFFESFEKMKKILEKKEKILELINYLKENKTYLKSLKETKNLKLLYEIILTNLIENNNNFIISQINLIKILSEQISNNENEEIKNDFINFFKKALPKLFDKFYLQNSKINNNLSEIFIFILDKKFLKFNDYFPLLENICIEEDEDYKINILNFILKLIKTNENIYKDDFPENIMNTIDKLNKEQENKNLNEISVNIIEILNERKKMSNNNINDEKKEEFEIPNTPLSQQDSKLAFSSFIKKISKAVRNEKLNKNVNNSTNNNIKDKEELNIEINIDNNKNNENEIINIEKNEEAKKENIFDNIEKENGQIEIRAENNEPKIKTEDKIKESIQDEKLINTPEKNDNIINESEDKIISSNINDTNETPDKSKRIMNHIKRKKSNENSNKNKRKEINEDDDTPIKEEKKESKEIKNNSKKSIKTRITRSRKLGVMVKPKTNKEKTKEKIKEEDDIKNPINKNEEQKNNQIMVNKANLNQEEIKEENNDISPIKEFEINNENKNENIIANIPENNLNDKILAKEEEHNMNSEIIQNLNKKKMMDDFDEIPIKTSINNNIINDNEENGIQIPKKISIDEFNKKIDSALEIENQDLLIKQNDEMNNNKKEEKEKEKEKEIDDPKFDEIKSILGLEICDLISSQKWENKKHAFEEINNLINERNIEMNYNDLFNYIKSKMKNFKETNFNIIREALNIFISLLKIKSLSKDNLLLLINTYFEKISDIKLKDNYIELINTAIEESIIDTGSIISNIISKISKKKNSKLLNEYSTLFSKLIEENDIKDLPINDIVKYCKLMAGNSNPQVRTSATNLICILYKYMGEDLKPLIKDIKESTLKMIEAELEKVTIIKNKEDDKVKNNKKIIKKNSKIGKKLNGEYIQESTINPQFSGPVDISKKINIYLKDLSEGKWSEKKEAIENIEIIISEANNNILSTGLNDIFVLIKSKLSDGNKNYVKMLISLITKFISSLKKEFKPWTKMIALSLIPNLSDKNQSIRKECEQCFDAWTNNIGIDSLIIHFPQFLKNDNVESRIEIMKYIKKYNKQFSKNLGENIYKELIDSLLICLQDRSNNVRNEAEDIVMLSLDFVDIDKYYKKIKDFKPAIEKDLKLILDNINEKYKNNIEKENNSENGENENIDNEDENNDIYHLQNYNSFKLENRENNKSSNKIIKKNTNKESSPDKTLNNIKEKMRNSLKMKKSANLEKSNINSSNFILNNEDKINDDNNYLSGNEEQENNIKNKALNSSNIKRKKIIIKTAEKEEAKKQNSKFAEKKEDINSENKEGKEGKTLGANSTVLRRHKNSLEKKLKINRKNTSNKNKNNKISNEIFNINNNMKIPLNKNKRAELDKKFKFSIDTIGNDDINKLKEYSKIIFIDDINVKIFENDLNKEIEFFNKIKYNIDTQLNLEFFFDNLDVILKIISIKINNNYNPSLLKHFYSLLESLYSIITEIDYHLTETESNIILCLLIDKLSINNNQIKDNSMNLIKQYIEIIDTNKIFVIILNYTLNKNNKVKSVILDMALELHLNKKINMTSKEYIKILSKYLSLNDNIIKSKCLKIFEELQGYLKEEVLNIKEKNNINENEEEEVNEENEEEDEENEDNIEENEIQDENNSDKIDNNEEEIYNSDNNYNSNNKNSENENESDNDNLNKYYLSEERYQNYNNNINNPEFITNDENNETSNSKSAIKINKASHNNYYMKSDNKIEEKQIKDNLKKPQNDYKNSEVVSKIQKIKTIKKNNNINDNINIKSKPTDKFYLPKKTLKPNNNKKLKVFNNKLNKSQKLKQKIKINASNKEINSENINNDVNNNMINNYANNYDNNSNGNSINQNENNDISISLYNMNQNSSKNINNNIDNNSSILTEKDLLEIMNNLFSEDESEKMGTIIIIHEILCSKYQQNKYILIPNIDNIIKIIIQITHELFESIDNLNNKIIPLKFAKYLTTILFKLTSNKELIFHISYKVLFDLCYELLNYLLINDLDKIGSNQEGNIIFKSLNSAMLRVLENCDTTSVILALLEIIKQNQNNKNSGLLCNLSMKCLYKVTQNVNQIINKIQLDKILLQMRLLTYNFDKFSNGKETNSQSNIMIIRFIKNLIIDLVKIKKGKILEDYNKSIANNQYKDKYIYNWIINALETLEFTENEEDNFIYNNNDLSKSTNLRSSSTNMSKNRLNNTDKKGENGGFILSNNNNTNIGNNNNLNKKSVIIVKKHASNNLNNRYNFNNNYNTQNIGNNITATKSSILGSSSISNNHRINVQKNINSKNSQIYNKNKKKNKFNK